jgi:hypothetical protein
MYERNANLEILSVTAVTRFSLLHIGEVRYEMNLTDFARGFRLTEDHFGES